MWLHCVYAVHFQTPHSRGFLVIWRLWRHKKRSRLSSERSNSVMRICMKGLLITKFKENYSNDCADYWYNSRSWSLNQQKRKKYKDRKVTKKQQPNFKVSDLESYYTTSDGSSDKENWLFVLSDSSLVYSSVVLYNIKFLSFL